MHGHASNLTILPGPGEDVYVHSRRGWELRSRESAAAELVARLGWVMVDLLSEVESTPLHALTPWFEERHAELTSHEPVARIMANYLLAAKRYYSALQPRPDAHDRREAARRILRTPPPELKNKGKTVQTQLPALKAEVSQPGHPTADHQKNEKALEHRPESGTPGQTLTDAEVEELLGW